MGILAIFTLIEEIQIKGLIVQIVMSDYSFSVEVGFKEAVFRNGFFVVRMTNLIWEFVDDKVLYINR